MCDPFAKHSQYTFDHLCIDYLAVFSPALYLECEQHTSLKPTHSGHTEAMCALVCTCGLQTDLPMVSAGV